MTTGKLSPLFQLLQGDSNPKSPRNLTPEAVKALALVEEQLNKAKVKQITYNQEWDLIIFKTPYTPTGCLWQNKILEWVHLPHTQAKMLASYPYMCSLIIKQRKDEIKRIIWKRNA